MDRRVVNDSYTHDLTKLVRTAGLEPALNAQIKVSRAFEVSPTSAVRGGQGRSFGHLDKKSPLHFGSSGDGRRQAEALGELEAEPVKERGLSGVRAHHAAQAELTTILGRQHDVGALNAA